MTTRAKKLRESRRERAVAEARTIHPDALIVRGVYYGAELNVEVQDADRKWHCYTDTSDPLEVALTTDTEAMIT